MAATPPAAGSTADPLAWLRAAPLVFVLIWATGFVVARYAMPHAPPLSFLTVRYACSVLVFLLWIAWARPAWPQGRRQWAHLAVCGVLMHAGYLGGVWAAVRGGLGAGLAALITGLQPLLTAIWLSAVAGAAAAAGSAAGPGHGHRVSGRQWLGLVLGLLGLLLVVGHKLDLGLARPGTVVLALLALASITIGTLYQKRFVTPCDVRTANTVQLLAALAVTAPLAAFETAAFVWHPELIGALAWSVLVLTLGGSSLLYLLIQRGAATTVTSLLYLVPPCTAVMAWVLFDEPLSLPVLAGFALTAVGVAVVVREDRAAAQRRARGAA